MNKLNNKGEYSLFPGITVVAACYPQYQEFCHAIHGLLINNELIKEYFSPLPAQSYHMTTMDLYTAKREHAKGNMWNDFVTTNLPYLRQVKQTLQANPVYPLIESIIINIHEQVISFTLPLSKIQEQQIRNTAHILNLEKAIPPFFHITLAYAQPGKKISTAHLEQLQIEIKNKLENIIATHLPIILDEPKLCYFNNMTAFHPWNAENNPFIEFFSLKNGFFNDSDKHRAESKFEEQVPIKTI